MAKTKIPNPGSTTISQPSPKHQGSTQRIQWLEPRNQGTLNSKQSDQKRSSEDQTGRSLQTRQQGYGAVTATRHWRHSDKVRGNIESRNQRVRGYLALVKPIAQYYANCSPEPLEDLLQVGLLGLLRAAESFNPDQETPFEAFAKPHIRGSILHYLRDVAQPIRLPRRLLEFKDRLNRLGLEQLMSLGLSQADQRRLREIENWKRPLSLDLAMEEELSTPLATEERIGSPFEHGEVLELLAHLEPQLEVVVRQVVLAGWSYRRTADRLHVSPMTVQRRLKRGLEMLKNALDGSGQGTNALRPQPCGHPAASAAPGC